MANKGLTHWLLAPGEWTHVFASSRAIDKLEEIKPHGGNASLRALQRQVNAIGYENQVAWIDIDDAGSWRVWQADHGTIPPEVTG
jgi:hypothetical protein